LGLDISALNKLRCCKREITIFDPVLRPYGLQGILCTRGVKHVWCCGPYLHT